MVFTAITWQKLLTFKIHGTLALDCGMSYKVEANGTIL